jgi:hypothetical protein
MHLGVIAVPQRSPHWIWAGRVVFSVVLAGLVYYLTTVGLEKADKVASCIAMVAALAGLVAPYLLPRNTADPDVVDDSGEAEATGGGTANTGIDVTDGTGSSRVARSGKATARGRDSVANSGITRRRPRS